ncbi:MAG: protease, partial [Chloroflexi bacterium]|nr:protease [Chloroflexota bacterium]
MDHVPPGSLEESPLGPTDLETTGRFLVLMREEAVGQGVQELSSVAGLRVARLSELADRGFELERGEAIVVDRLDIAIVNAPPDQLAALSGTTTGQSVIVAIEPERVVHVLAPDHDHFEPPPAAALGSAAVGVPRDYLLGYRDAVNHLVDGILAKSVLVTEAAGFDETRLTWGVQVTNAATSPYTGAGVHVAVLDTGLDLGHPDFAGRRVTSQSF